MDFVKRTAFASGIALAAALLGCSLDLMAPPPPAHPPLIGAARWQGNDQPVIAVPSSMPAPVNAAAPGSVGPAAPAFSAAPAPGNNAAAAEDHLAPPSPMPASAPSSPSFLAGPIEWFSSFLNQPPPPAPEPVRLGW